ncbi:unnamed protein product [Nezara viridula]|uniref:Uncharacterized protein n=1 Tax=Nezara viridula TaxID=85310 RepID=A0A9P0HUL0_NEZVI|nr:unnamed protein product [Nezara viridula]
MKMPRFFTEEVKVMGWSFRYSIGIYVCIYIYIYDWNV